ncbi:MAG TPA: PH domain-containing protein [Candidatus Acidoferrum sp.]
MSYVEKNLVPGETLLYETRHHWIVLLGPLFLSLILGALGVWLLWGAMQSRNGGNNFASTVGMGPEGMSVAAVIVLVIALAIFLYGNAKRNATEMAVTNRRVLIKTGMASRRTLDLMLSRVESIGVEESVTGRMMGFGTVIVRGTGGTPEQFVMIAHPQEFRRAVQEQSGLADGAVGK